MNLNDFIEVKKIADEAKGYGALAYYDSHSMGFDVVKQIQLSSDAFKEFFTGSVSADYDRGTDEFPIELSFWYAGHNFFTVLDNDEYEEDFREWIENNEAINKRPRGVSSDELKMKEAGHKTSDFI